MLNLKLIFFREDLISEERMGNEEKKSLFKPKWQNTSELKFVSPFVLI